MAEYEKRGIRIVAISVDPPEVTKPHIEKQGYAFTFLCDPKMEVIRAWDLMHSGGHRGEDIARPAEFVIDSTGTIRWVNLTENYRVRTKGEEVLRVIEDLGLAPASQ